MIVLTRVNGKGTWSHSLSEYLRKRILSTGYGNILDNEKNMFFSHSLLIEDVAKIWLVYKLDSGVSCLTLEGYPPVYEKPDKWVYTVNTLTGTIGDVAASMPRYLMGEMAGMVAYYYQLTVRPDRWWDAMRVMDRLYTSLEPVPKTGDNMRLQLAFHSTALIQSAMGE